MNTVAALDPGRDKCGFAALSLEGAVLFQKVISTSELEKEILKCNDEFSFDLLIIGNGTTSKAAQERVKNVLSNLEIKVVDEYKTTELARSEYFKINPPKGWRRLLPITMQTPPVPVDDYVAVILAKRYLAKLGSESDG
ncbi:MAG: pre-16S rRNA-processing nuclease YqgF [Selenomonadaceae bacterium]|nr:pre-16S rRNA-processing nuclease YqgF [Selenomonadaceae bacterium]MBR3723455.1 pre-16S rRNA-processing nuclease YqgF [Selenomonadaceae bacterium]